MTGGAKKWSRMWFHGSEVTLRPPEPVGHSRVAVAGGRRSVPPSSGSPPRDVSQVPHLLSPISDYNSLDATSFWQVQWPTQCGACAGRPRPAPCRVAGSQGQVESLPGKSGPSAASGHSQGFLPPGCGLILSFKSFLS